MPTPTPTDAQIDAHAEAEDLWETSLRDELHEAEDFHEPEDDETVAGQIAHGILTVWTGQFFGRTGGLGLSTAARIADPIATKALTYMYAKAAKKLTFTSPTQK